MIHLLKTKMIITNMNFKLNKIIQSFLERKVEKWRRNSTTYNKNGIQMMTKTNDFQKKN